MSDKIQPEARRVGSAEQNLGGRIGRRRRRDRGLASGKRIWMTLALLAAMAVAMGVRHTMFIRTHVVTDEASVVCPLVQLSSQAKGRVRVYVRSNQPVRAGQLLVTIDDAVPRTEVAQCQANLDAAVAEARGSGFNVELARANGDAEITQAQGVVAGSASEFSSAYTALARERATLSAAVAEQKRCKAAVISARATVIASEAEVEASQARVDAAQAVYENAAREEERYLALAEQGACSREKADQVVTVATGAKAALATSREKANACRAELASQKADLEGAQEQGHASDAAIDQARAQMTAAREGISQARAVRSKSQGVLSLAKTASIKVKADQAATAQARAKVAEARAALRMALLRLSYCRVYSPCDGYVGKKRVTSNAIVRPGAELMVIVSRPAWVIASYEETQVSRLTPGSRAEVRIDAVPRRVYTGHVDGIQACTSSTFELLPPENAPGNLLKVRQRVPVKIVLDAHQKGADLLRAGMSARAAIFDR